MLVLQAILAATVVLAVYELSAEIGGSRAGTIGAWLAACWPQWVTSAATFASEQINTSLVAAALVLTLAVYRRASDRHAMGAGLAFALAALARSTSLYLAPLMAALVATRRKTSGFVMALMLLAVTVPYIITISRSAGRVVLIENLYEWNWAAERAGGVSEASSHARLSDMPGDFATVIAREPGRMLWSALSRLKNVLFSEDFWEFSLRAQAPAPLLRWRSPIVAAFLILLYGAGLLGIWYAPNRNGAVLLVVWIALHCLVGTGLAGDRTAAPDAVRTGAHGACRRGTGKAILGRWGKWQRRRRAVSSVVEHRLYTPAVTGSNPVPPTSLRAGETARRASAGEPAGAG